MRRIYTSTRKLKEQAGASHGSKSWKLPQRTRTSDTSWWEARLLCRMVLCSPLQISSVAEEFWRNNFGSGILAMHPSKARSSVRFEAEIRLRLKELAKKCPDGTFAKNSQALADLLGLDEAALAVLRLVTIFETAGWLSSMSDNLCDSTLGCSRSVEFLADVLEVGKNDLLQALESDSPLIRSGIVSFNDNCNCLGGFLSMPEGLARSICTERKGLDGMMRAFVDPSPRIDLDLSDFSHMQEAIKGLRECLCNPPSVSPAHILLSGPPGTGKTQFALALCRALGKHPVLAPSETSKGSASAGSVRRAALSMAMQVLGSDNEAVLVVDEAENLVEADSFALLLGRKSAPSPEKAWLNRFLESAKLPMIWIVNTPDALDPSVLRRFTWTIPFRIPPRTVRRRILDRHLGNQGLSESFLDELAERDDLAPYEASRLARIGSMAHENKEDRLRMALDFSDRFLRHSPPAVVRHATKFDANLLNLTADPLQLLDGLSRRRTGRLGFFGPPGTGKSMLATEIARIAESPLVLKTGSDLLDKFIGETEKNIARAFEEAADEKAVLFLDEVDSIAGDRSRAERSWERTQTNELLIRLERFSGIAILATNHLDALDPAVARRIDRKIEFRDLRPEQAWSLFVRHVPDASDDFFPQLASLPGLRLGDYAAALRSLEVEEQPVTAPALLKTLRHELEFRPNFTGRSMGFVA